MWITKQELNKTRTSEIDIKESYERIEGLIFEEPEIVEHKNIVMVSGDYLKILFQDIEDVYTSFIKTDKKIVDGDGGLTGVGLNLRDYAKLFKKNKCEKFESSVLIPYTDTCMISTFKKERRYVS
jgi:hypothetical protein